MDVSTNLPEIKFDSKITYFVWSTHISLEVDLNVALK